MNDPPHPPDRVAAQPRPAATPPRPGAGQPTAVFRANYGKFIGVFFGLFYICSVASFVAWASVARPPNRTGADVSGWMAFMAVLGLISSVFACILIRNLALLFRRVVLYLDGVRVKGPFRSTFLPWSEMESVRYYMGVLRGGISGATGRGRRVFSGKCVVRFRGGRTLRVTDMLRGHLDLCQAIDAAFCREMLPGALERIRTGGVVPFGPFTVAADGLVYDREKAPWSAIDRIDLVGLGMVEVFEHGRSRPWMRVNVGKVPDSPLFFVLTGELLRRAAFPRAADPSALAPPAGWEAPAPDARPSGALQDRIEVRPPPT
jgi:hypothetical protein